jgi:hypothetical protein
MSIEKSIKERASLIGMDLCGIAPVSRFEGAPQGTHPTDTLPGCRSVIVVGLRLLDGAIQTIFRNFEDGKRAAQGVYGTYGYTMAPNFTCCMQYMILRSLSSAKLVLRPCLLRSGPLQPADLSSASVCRSSSRLGEFGWLSIVLTLNSVPEIVSEAFNYCRN